VNSKSSASIHALLAASMLLYGRPIHGGDILRGGAPANQRNPALGNPATSAAADAARSNARDSMARTAQAIQSVQNMQNAARLRAAATGADRLKPGLTAPTNGLSPNGLNFNRVVSGATAPTQQIAGGRYNVTVKQTAQQAFLEWNKFNISRSTSLYFDQSAGGAAAGQWIAFNRVTDPSGEPSQIMGQIRAQGQVYVLNQNGIIFGGTSQVNVHALVASSLPINENLTARGLLNNPDNQFLFSALPINAGSQGTPAFTPAPPPAGRIGDVEVQAGAQLTAPTTAAKVGGRVVLVGPNVINAGTLSAPDGQVIMAAGLQVGFAAHDSNDPSIRGLDVYVGKVSDPSVATVSPITGTVTNRGFIDIPRGNATLSGKLIQQLGVISSSTSVALNGSIRLDASYDAVPNVAGNTINRSPFLFQSTGTVELGPNSITAILPELSAEKVVGTKLALPSRIDVRGKVIHLGQQALIHAPNANVTLNAGIWNYVPSASTPVSSFVRSSGQVYLDAGSMINVAGTTNAQGLLTDNIITLQLRGAEFADSPYNRNGPLRGIDITLDLRRQGVYNGFAWVGTPLADASGYLGIVQRGVDQLTTAGGNVTINAGNSVVMQPGSVIDVSGGYTNYAGGLVKTTRVTYGGNIFDISQATPDVVWDGIYTGTSNFNHPRWGITRSYTNSFMLGQHYEPGYIYGAAGGSINITAPQMALDGSLRGQTINGPRQRDLPAQPSTLNLAFQGEKIHSSGTIIPFNPAPPTVLFQSGISQTPANPFDVANLNLRDDRRKRVILSPEALEEGGFGFIKVDNSEGNVVLAAGETLRTPALGGVDLKGANIDIQGSIVSPGGTISLKAYNISPSVAAGLAALSADDPLRVTPTPNANRGIIRLGPNARLDAAGLLVDDRLSSPNPGSLPLALTGGSVSVAGYTTDLAAGSVIDVSGGARIDWDGVRTYADAGAISLRAGNDLNIAAVLGGRLNLRSTLMGYAGPRQRGGLLDITAPFIQIGGATSNPNVTLLQPSFFNQGGFSSFVFTGLGSRADGSRTPGISIAPGAQIDPQVLNRIIVPFGGGADGLLTRVVSYPESLRSPVSISFNAPTLNETYALGASPIVVRGDILMGQGASIDAGVLGNVQFKAGTVSILGSVTAPGGSIGIQGASSYPTDAALSTPLPTVYLGPRARLSTAGTTVIFPDVFGRRAGYVSPGGIITIAGNIVLEAGSSLDVSGASGLLDLPPANLGLDTFANPIRTRVTVPGSSGLTTDAFAYDVERVRVDSDGGLISLSGGQLLLSRATFNGSAGGPTAVGGTLLVSSGRFYAPGVTGTPSDANLQVTQGSTLPGAFFTDGRTGVGRVVTGFNGGYFAVNDFVSGGFDNLQLGGNVNFKGPINIDARGALSVASGGFLYADSTTNLSARYIGLGTAFAPPYQVGEVVQPFTLNGSTYTFTPTTGPGVLNVRADVIDIGNLSLSGIGTARLTADNGSIRGNGTFSMRGDLFLRAGQIYPTTGSEFTIAVYDPSAADRGSVTISRSGTLPLPLSAGGTLNIYATDIVQGGVLRAPFGVINLGWDGTGTAPTNLVVGSNLALPTTRSVSLLNGSITSVSAIDPITGQPVLIPYGRFNPDDGTWIGPNGQNITVSGLPQKAINISGQSIDSRSGSVIDIRGGGDLYAYSWAPGLNGTRDILGTAEASWSTTASYNTGDLVTYRGQTWSARQPSSGITPGFGFFWTPLPETYAILPGYSDIVSPFAAFNTRANALLGDPGYISRGLNVGDSILIGGAQGLRSGSYTLLPARYGLLPGAFTISPMADNPYGSFGGNAIGRNALPDGSRIVNGYRYNGLNEQRQLNPIYSRWHLMPSESLRNSTNYTDYFANSFIAEYARENNLPVQRLPQDSGQLVFSAVTAMNLNGSVLTKPVGPGKGGLIDITSAADIFIGDRTSTPPASSLFLNAGQLSSFGAESLLIGGTRKIGTTGTTVSVRTNSITVDNDNQALIGPEIILASNRDLIVEEGAIIRQTGRLSGPGDLLQLSGPGALLRVTSDPAAQVVRSGITAPSSNVGLQVGSNALISGAGLILDSTGLRDSIADGARILGQSIAINSGIMRLSLDDTPVTGQGLVIGSQALNDLSRASSLSLLSYSTMDIYGGGTVGNASLQNLSIHAAAIRRLSGTDTALFQAKNILIDNSANVSVTPAQLTGSSAGALQFTAERITLGQNRVQIARYANVGLDASAGFFLTGRGGLSVSGNVTGNMPFITATSGLADQAITATGALVLNGTGGPAISRDKAGLGSSITLSGNTVDLGTNIALPSGSVTASSVGAMTISGVIDVGGASRSLFDVNRYTDGGSVNLSSANGNITVDGSIDVSALAAGGDAGRINVSSPNGAFVLNGNLAGNAGLSGVGGSFSLDTRSLADFSGLTATLNNGAFTNQLAFRIRTGNVTVDGNTISRDFSLSADAGSVNVTGTIDAAGTTGGSIRISAANSLTVASGATLDASAARYDNAGKGGSIFLETRSNASGALSLATGSTLDLSVAQAAEFGQFSGTLHLRAPQNAAATNLAINPIRSTITGASSIIAEGFRVFDLTGAGGQITTAVQNNVLNNGNAFGANAAAIETSLLASNPSLANAFTVRVGAELVNATGDLTLGTATGAVTNWDLSTFRFGAVGDKAPGILTLRARGDVTLYGTLSDGFASAAYNAQLLSRATNLPDNAQSWSYRITAGADTTAADSGQVLATSALTAGKGSLVLGKFVLADAPGGSGQSASTAAALNGNYQVIRTGSGDIDISAGRDIQLRNQFATIYTAGTRVADPTLGGRFDTPAPTLSGNSSVLGNQQQVTLYAAQYSMGGGDIGLRAAGDIGHFAQDAGTLALVADSSLQMPTNWLYRRGYVDPLTGQFGSIGSEAVSTSWWVDYSNFFQGIGALGGGNIAINAGGNVTNLDAVIPTNARMPRGTPDASTLVELGGGDINIRAGRDIDAGVYYVERGHGSLTAGARITVAETNLTRRAVPQKSTPESMLPTTLFVGKGSFSLDAKGDILLGPISNPFMLPGGINNGVFYKSYFSTIGADSGVEATSLGGDITFRNSVTPFRSSNASPILLEWYRNILQYNRDGSGTSNRAPWLRLNETDVTAFASVSTIGAANLRLSALAGDVNWVGSYNLYPSARGNLSVEAAGAVNAIQSLGTSTLAVGSQTRDFTIYTIGQVNLSDANPALIPNAATPVAYRSFTTVDQDRTDAALNFLSAISTPFAETGSLTSATSTQQALHASGILHKGDTQPVRIYAGGGDISGLTLFSPKASRIIASRDISDIAFYLQNTGAEDISIISAGRDLLPYTSNTPLRSLVNTPTSLLAQNQPGALAGDISLGGPGTLQVLAGKDIRLGNGASNADGTGAGILTIGNARNPALPFEGADLILAAGIGPAYDLGSSALDFDAFISSLGSGAGGNDYFAQLGNPKVMSQADFQRLSPEEQRKVALDLFFLVLRGAGRDFNTPGKPGFGNYAAGEQAIATLFGSGYDWSGDIQTNARDIRTKSGGDITMLIPGGDLTLQTQQSSARQVPPGIITEAGGNINIFTDQGVNIGISRIFTLRGGSQVIWASNGDIAAGSSSKTVQSAPPTRVLIDPTSADVKTDLAGLATGGGIGVLATIAGVAPGSVDLIAPRGAIDAGDAGIRSTGNLNLAAAVVLNANNIASGGTTAGAPAAPAAPAVAVTAPANASGAAASNTGANAANAARNTPQQAKEEQPKVAELPSVISVEVIGYGGGDEDDEEERKKKRE
jgi:filamentous hemagglutinin